MKSTTLLESQVLKKINQAKLEKKNPSAWKKLEELGKKISSRWEISKTSLQLISEGRR